MLSLLGFHKKFEAYVFHIYQLNSGEIMHEIAFNLSFPESACTLGHIYVHTHTHIALSPCTCI